MTAREVADKIIEGLRAAGFQSPEIVTEEPDKVTLLAGPPHDQETGEAGFEVTVAPF